MLKDVYKGCDRVCKLFILDEDACKWWITFNRIFILFVFCYINFTIHSFINNNIFETFWLSLCTLNQICKWFIFNKDTYKVMNDITFFLLIYFYFILPCFVCIVQSFCKVCAKCGLVYKIFIQDIIFFSSFMKINSTIKNNHPPNRILKRIFNNDLFNIYNSDIQFKTYSIKDLKLNINKVTSLLYFKGKNQFQFPF